LSNKLECLLLTCINSIVGMAVNYSLD
jgi:hypothetical protein